MKTFLLRHTILLGFWLCCVAIIASDYVSNVDAKQYGKQIVITYQLAKSADVGVLLSLNGGQTYQNIKSVTGDVGKNVKAGSNRIYWDVLADYEQFVFQNVRFKVEASVGKTSFDVSGVTFTMIDIAGGTFYMGCTSDQGNLCNEDEKPVHEVSLSDFYMAETEVTQRLWQVVMGTSITRQKEKAQATTLAGEDSNFPMYYVNYDEALLFCQRLNKLLEKQIPEGYSFSLPTEAQWEYAARGGQKDRQSIYAGSDELEMVAWCTSNAKHRVHPVKSKLPNELGLYDMTGNVWEWCLDRYNPKYYSRSLKEDPRNLSSGSQRVNRGGAWHGYAGSWRVARRNSNDPGERNDSLGFRIVLTQTTRKVDMVEWLKETFD